MLPMRAARAFLFFSSSAAAAESSAIFLSISAFFANCSEASPLAFLMVLISFWTMLTSLRADSDWYRAAYQSATLFVFDTLSQPIELGWLGFSTPILT